MATLIDTIRQSAFRRFVDQKINRSVRHHPVSLSAARKIGILFTADYGTESQVVEEYAESLRHQGKEVKLLAYLNKRNYSKNYLFPYITGKDITWFGKPKGGTTGFFIKYPFDILINFCDKEVLPLEYISALSHASFRIGFNEKNILEPYDCILLTDHDRTTRELIAHIHKYLS
jgi:hypothetical protein